LRRWNTIDIQTSRDLGERQTLGPLIADPSRDVGRERRSPARTHTASGASPRRFSPFDQEPLELVDRDEPRSPLRTDGRDRRDHTAVERGETHAECLGGLLPGVCETSDLLREP
jgi:hypothetical protein